MLGSVLLVFGCVFLLVFVPVGIAELVYRIRRRRIRRRQFEREFRDSIERARNGVELELDLRERRRLVQRELDRLRR